jgi:FkbM family methyltransferase
MAKIGQFLFNARHCSAKVGKFVFWRRTVVRQFLKRVLGRGSELRLPNGRRVWLPPESGVSSVVWVTSGALDDGFEELFRSLGEAGTAFFDVGAHFGFYCAFLCDRHAPVVAFEPDARTLPSLHRNLAGIAGSVCIPAAASDRCGQLNFFSNDSSGMSRLLPDGSGAVGGNVKVVDVTTVDETWRRLGKPKVGAMKIDTEGHEGEVLAGAREMIEACQPVMLIEATCASLAPHREWLEPLGYVALRLSPRLYRQAQSLLVVRLAGLESVFSDGMIILAARPTMEGPGWSEVAAGRFNFTLAPSNLLPQRLAEGRN